MTSFGEQFKHFANAVDIVNERVLEDALQSVADYLKNRFKIGLCELAYPHQWGERIKLKALQVGAQDSWDEYILLGGAYNGHISYAYAEHKKMWVVARNKRKLTHNTPFNELEDLLGNAESDKIPNYTDVNRSKNFQLSYLIPLGNDKEGLGVLNFECSSYLRPEEPPGSQLKKELEPIADAFTLLCRLFQAHQFQYNNTKAALHALKDFKNNDEAPDGESADVVIICALHKPELEKVKETGDKLWELVPSEPHDPHRYYKTAYTTLRGNSLNVFAAAPTQMGLTASAVLATKMILRFRPKLVAIVGIAAGVKVGTQNFGDILAAEYTFDYGAGKITSKDDKLVFKPDPQPRNIPERLRVILKDWAANRTDLDAIKKKWGAGKPSADLELHVGPLASGAAVIDHSGQVEDIVNRWRKVIGVEMEAYAVHCACDAAVEPAPKFLCFKSICDFAQEKTDDWQLYAAYTAAEFCYRFLITEWEELR